MAKKKTTKKSSAGGSQWQPEIKNLEHRIGELISLCNTLREENGDLRGKIQDVITERDELVEKNQLTVKSVESILSSVKILEKQS
ncbi:MAG: TIGR02449 family protein [Gammaproteobacteria bacterium]|uniref:TIGR02449 family protein n=1 Tax=Candidatus Thiopontia autotrophica TaxID=2841688 RepID=A0A8J6NWT7_9GAMM|nr:TIGR02449 family protein [Candidatus Thiopontia autotrophica]MBL6969367.1 TIGR02449 family protein [Gammaproteobacteria bacterium]